MAPLSRLLVYYVRENGEGVTDSLQIPIQPDFENQVCIILKHKESLTASSFSLFYFTQKGFIMTCDLQIRVIQNIFGEWRKKNFIYPEKSVLSHI